MTENKINTKSLNEKLLKFAGFTFVKGENDFTKMNTTVDHYIYPNGKKLSKKPDLVNSLDEQAKWIYPKLAENDIRIELSKDYDNHFKQHAFYWSLFKGHSLVGYGEDMTNPALAFALAVEKLIDNLEKENG